MFSFAYHTNIRRFNEKVPQTAWRKDFVTGQNGLGDEVSMWEMRLLV